MNGDVADLRGGGARGSGVWNRDPFPVELDPGHSSDDLTAEKYFEDGAGYQMHTNNSRQ